MFGNIRDFFLNNTISEKSINNNEKVNSLISGIGSSVLYILDKISGVYYNVDGTENIPKDRTFILIANHPGPLDYFPIRKSLQQAGVDMYFFAHKNLIHHPLTRDFSRNNKLIGVRRFDYDNPEKNKLSQYSKY